MIFDGLMLFIPRNVSAGLPERPGIDLDPACRIVDAKRENGDDVQISIRLVSSIDSTSPSSLQVSFRMGTIGING